MGGSGAPSGMHGGDSLICNRLPCPDSESLDLMLRAMARDGRDLFDLLRLVRLTHAAMDRAHADAERAHADADKTHLDMAEGSPSPAAITSGAGSSKQPPPRTHTLSASAYSSLIRACVNGGQVKEARRLLRDMERRGVPPTQAAVNMIAHMHFVHADPDAALSLLHHVRAAHKLPMNAVLLTTYVWGLGQAGRVEEAEELLLGAVGGGGGMGGRNGGNGGNGGNEGDRLDGEGVRYAAVQPNVRTWNALMHGYAIKGDADAAEGVLGLMRGEGGAMGGGERFEGGGGGGGGENGVGEDGGGTGGCEEEDEEGGEGDGLEEGVSDGDEEYEEGEKVMEVGHAEKAGDFNMRQEHDSYHQQQQQAEISTKRKPRFPWPSVRPNTVTYTTLMAAYAAAGRSAEVWDVYREMRSLSIPPNHFTFATLVSSCAARSRPDLIESVLADVAACQQRADVALVTSVLAGVAGCCSGRKEEAGRVLRLLLGEVESEGGVGEACARLILQDGLCDAQVHSLVHLLFSQPSPSLPSSSSSLPPPTHLSVSHSRPHATRAHEVLASTLTDCLWTFGRHRRAALVLSAALQAGLMQGLGEGSGDAQRNRERGNARQGGGAATELVQLGGDTWQLDVRRLSYGGAAVALNQWLVKLLHVVHCNDTARRQVGAAAAVTSDSPDERSRSEARHQRDAGAGSSMAAGAGESNRGRGGSEEEGGTGSGGGTSPSGRGHRARRAQQQVEGKEGRAGGGAGATGGGAGGGAHGVALGGGGAGAAACGEADGVWAGPGGVAERAACCCHAATRGP
ncbi:unnamed protein product [Closterium sp. Naga37s-1]|nr:unnamed protein product [Closterium sp. Naga37s-1]